MEEPKNEETRQQEVKQVKNKTGKRRMKLVISFIVLVLIIAYANFRGEFLEILEISESYTDIFWQNLKYNGIAIAINFVILFIILYTTNNGIKKGLKPFFDQEKKGKHSTRFLPAGQTTQMIVGASPESDGQILRLSEAFYRKFSMKRVYYSSYVPVVHHALLPKKCTGLLREHRLYQADWLMRFYGFTADEIAGTSENLPEEYDPKCAWALKNMHLFPVEINSAPLEMLLRVPGIGNLGAYKILKARKFSSLGFEDLTKMRIVLKRAKHFITCNGKFFGS